MTLIKKILFATETMSAIALAVTGKFTPFLSAFLFMLGLWQLDHFVAPYIWRMKGNRIEVLPRLTMEVTEFYVLCLVCVTLGYFVMVISALVG